MDLTDLAANFNLNTICRLCMGKGLNLLPLFVQDNILSEKIMAIIPVLKLSADDGLPGQVCLQCVNQVNTSYNFKLQSYTDMKRDKRYFCNECDKGFGTLCDLTRHLQIHAGEKGFSCQFCGKDFVMKESLRAHYKLHPGEKPFECNKCDEKFSRYISLKKHLKTHLEKYICDICGQQFCSQRSLKDHLIIHSGEKAFSCEICGKKFSLKKNLNFHLYAHSNEKPYSCEECGMCFKQRQTLSNHMKTHGGEKNFVCVECGKKFLRKRDMQLHMLCHTGEKPIECSQCTKTFARKENLVKHMRTHTGLKPFICAKCGKAFTTNQQLKHHTITHEEVKPFMCTECGKTFARKDRLKDHLATHSGKRPFSCPHCGKGFVRKDHLQCHLNTTHGGKDVLKIKQMFQEDVLIQHYYRLFGSVFRVHYRWVDWAPVHLVNLNDFRTRGSAPPISSVTMTINFSKICRLCMIESEKLTPIFGNNDFPAKIISLSPVIHVSYRYLHAEDDLPQQICLECEFLVHTSYNFKMKCEESSIKLQELIQKQNCKSKEQDYELDTMKIEMIDTHINMDEPATDLDTSSDKELLNRTKEEDIKYQNRENIGEKDLLTKKENTETRKWICDVCGKMFKRKSN
ncbi:hypothetical protein L9F63_015998 [Diploptera punctata]|uniref:Gastrula zinc finger protein XlCGF57.1-like n=1 Tax=Diploptera punctata TaxID=6984 RepID=A0AAD8EIA9_DIPPU|nr:hypothetical protein L9F63_015998 [Diploptera punctata]